jgi:hypothetical protein
MKAHDPEIREVFRDEEDVTYPAPDKKLSDWSAEDIMDNVRRYWNLDGPLPIPHAWPDHSCPFGHRPVQFRHWQFHEAPRGPRARVPYRCDVSFKCGECSMVWVQAPALDEDTYNRMTENLTANRRVAWSMAAELMDIDY